MSKLLALLACVEAHEGPWLRPCGRETGVEVYPELGSGERVELEVEGDPVYDKITFALLGGFTPLTALAKVTRFRVVKTGRGTPTSVEIVTNGKASAPSPPQSSERTDDSRVQG